MNNKAAIEHQKNIALRILQKLECADPNAILAGGAPRDWYFGNIANDLDFYVHLPQNTQKVEEFRWKRLGLDVKPVNYEKKEHNKYKMMPDLFRMYEGEIEGVKIQIMVMLEKTFKSVLPFFGSSICKVWWKGKDIETTTDFLISVYNKKIYTMDGYLETDYHIQKMKKYFREYAVVDYDQVGKDINELASELKLNKWSISFNEQLNKIVSNTKM